MPTDFRGSSEMGDIAQQERGGEGGAGKEVALSWPLPDKNVLRVWCDIPREKPVPSLSGRK